MDGWKKKNLNSIFPRKMTNEIKEILIEIKSDIEEYKKYKFGIYEFILQNYYSSKHSEKIPPEKIIKLFKEISNIDTHIEKLNRIIRFHEG